MSDERITVHLAVIEWADDSAEPYITAGRDLEAVRQDIRRVIEGEVSEDAVEFDDDVDEYIATHRDVVDWDEWHDALHELDGTPWVTITEKEI